MHNTTGGSQNSVSQEMTHLGETSVRTQVLGISASQHLPHHQLQQKPGDPAGQVQAASPISSRPPNFEELVPVTGNFPDEDALASEEGERGPAGTRWPRQETLALLKIRSDMDGVFRDATLKGPLWEDVSRKLAELGYIRSGKKCKEKFENVQKYYKRTKEGRAGRQDGKSYRFFSQLEALHNCSTTSNLDSMNQFPQIQPAPLSSAPPFSQTQMPRSAPDITAAPAAGSGPPCAAGGILFSSNSSSSEDDSEEEIEKAVGQGLEIRKRKRSESGGGSRKTMALFEGLMREVIEKQEAMQQKFLETMEKREQERMIREEAWKRQEMARLSREQELMAQERAMAASRDTAVIAFLQKISGQMMQIPSAVATQATTPAPLPQSLAPPEPPPQTPAQPAPSVVPQLLRDQEQPQQEQPQPLNKGPQHSHLQQQPEGQQPPQNTEIVSTEIVPFQEQQPHHQPQEIVTTGSSFEAVSSRWPKAEVLALIKLRSGLEPRYQEAGPKGLLWEEISAGMGRMGYNRSAKRCKEKWENINKYFKKVKESNKKRPEDAKTCPYFSELDALYRRKILGGGGSEEGSRGEVAIRAKQDEESELNPEERCNAVAAMSQSETETKNHNIKHGEGETGPSSLQMQASNGSLPPTFLEDKAVKKPADIMKELMGHHQNHRQQQSVMDYYHKHEETDNTDDLDQEEDDNEEEEDDDNEEEEDEEEEHLAYKIQCKRQTRDSSNPGGDEKEAMAPPGSFLAMV